MRAERVGRRGDQVEVVHRLAATPDAAGLGHRDRGRMRGELLDDPCDLGERGAEEARPSAGFFLPALRRAPARIFSSLLAPMPESSRRRPPRPRLKRVEGRHPELGPDPGRCLRPTPG